ncbi:KSR2 Kinase, partial [Baryphthengus martii]|nr:KSR2 Kinase [Baryphthengus martii]
QSKLVKYFSRQLSCKRKVALQERNAKLEGFPQLLHWFRIVDIRKEVMEEIAPGQLSLEELLDMTDDQVCATVEKFGANSEECARLNASLSCLRSVHKSGGSLSKQDWTIQWPTTEPGKENSPGCQPGQWGRTHLSQSPRVQPKCGQHHCHASSPHGPMYTHVDRLTVEGHPGLCPPVESGHRSLPPSPRQRHAAHTPPRTPNIVTTMTPPGTPPVRRRNKLKPPGTPPPSSRKLIHLIPGFTALHRSKSHEFQLGHRVDEAHTPKRDSQPKQNPPRKHVAAAGSGRCAKSRCGEDELPLPLIAQLKTSSSSTSKLVSHHLPLPRLLPCFLSQNWFIFWLGFGCFQLFLLLNSWLKKGSVDDTPPCSSSPSALAGVLLTRLGSNTGIASSATASTSLQVLGLRLLSRASENRTGMICVALACHPRSSALEHLGAATALTSSSLLSFPVSCRTTSQCPTSQIPAATPPPPPPRHPPRQPHRCRPARHPRPPCTPPHSARASRSSSTCQNEEGPEEAQESEDDFEEMNLSLLSARNFPRKASQTSIFLQEWDIPFEQLEIGELIGKGRFGQVFHGRWHGEVAIRLIDIERDNEDQLKAFKREVMAYRQTRHENVVLFMGACMSPPHLAIITSLCKGRTLYSVVRDAKIVLDVNKTRQIAQEIVKGMGYLHAKGILHKDLKSKNVFYDNGKVVITDFGLFSISGVLQAGRRENKLRIQNGWLCHLAPEIIRQLSPDTEEDKLPFSKHSDVFALGTIWYELHAREWPFKTQPAEAIIWQVGRGMKPNLSQIGMGKEISDILLFCWAYEQEERPTFTKLMDMLEKLPKRNRRLSHPGHFWKSAE